MCVGGGVEKVKRGRGVNKRGGGSLGPEKGGKIRVFGIFRHFELSGGVNKRGGGGGGLWGSEKVKRPRLIL